MSNAVIAESKPITQPVTTTNRLSVFDLLMLVAVVIWASHFSVAKAAVDVLPPFIYNAFRFTLGLLIMAIAMKVLRIDFSLPRTEWKTVIKIALMSYIVYQAFFMNGLRHTSVANSVLIMTTAPGGVVLVNIFKGRERGNRRIYTGILTALFGVGIVVAARYAGQFSFSLETLLGDALSMGAASIWIVNVLAHRRLLDNNPAMVLSFWMLFVGTIAGWVIAIPDLLQLNWSTLQPPVWLAIVYSAVAGICIAGTIWALGMKRMGSSRAALYVNLQPIVASAIAIVTLGEPFTLWLVIGTALVLLGMWRVRQG